MELVRLRALGLLGEYREGFELCSKLLIDYAPRFDVLATEHMELRITESYYLWSLNRVDEAIDKLHRIRAELLRQPDSSHLARCAIQISSAEMRRGGFQQARDFALESVVSARRSGDRYLEAMALNNYGQIERTYCRWHSAEEHCSRALSIAQEQEWAYQVNHCRRSLAITVWKRGKLDSSLPMANLCVEEARAAGQAEWEWFASLLKGLILVHAGQFDDARRVFEGGKNWTAVVAVSRPSLLTTEFLGDIHLEQGQAERALKHYDDVWPKALALVPKGDIVAELRRRRAECYYLLGRHDEAYAEAKIGLDHCRELGDRYEEAATYRVLGLTAAAVGNVSEANRWFTQGFAYYDDIETPYEWGKLWMSYGDWLRGPHAGEYADVRGALEAYHAAREQFERMGAAAKFAEANARIATVVAALQPAPTTSESDLARPPRRPRASAEIERRSAWAAETYGFITRNRMVLDLLTEVGKLAVGGAHLLILGESGTGKELVAQGFHRQSGRSGGFVPINCGALPRDVVESELFGHVSGAFTGATRDKPGLFEICDHGTAFLDEIAEMSIDLQSRLLRFLETGEIRRVGANRTLRVDTLVVAATNRERAALEKGEGFRTDLYYRLAHAVVVIPPLRRRGDDVDLLLSHFLEKANRVHRKQVTLTPAARNRLNAHPWPGNVRQLNAAMRRLVILAPPDHAVGVDEVQLEDPGVAGTLTEELEQAERRRMAEALAQAKGSRSDAARALGMARTTFVTKMKRYGMR
jgi:DNA-binding NtrC family response regulator